ncbi:MAG: hypothetical protein ABSB49_10710, partial [Polyangia bacterium]
MLRAQEVPSGSAPGEGPGGQLGGPAGNAPGDVPGEGGAPALKPPRLVHFVQAEYPKAEHDAGRTAQVLLSIEIGDDGRVGNVE